MIVRVFDAVVCVLIGTFGGASIGNAADLSRYHQFRIGSDVATVARATGAVESDVKVLHQRPALIQELEWRPDRSESSSEFEAVRVVVFSFSDGQLFRMFVDYDRNKTEGLSADDLMQSISEVYGAPTRPVATITTGSLSDYYAYASTEPVLARWQDEEYSVSLIRSSQRPNFGLIITSRNMDRLGQKAMIEGARLDVLAAPQVERDRLAKQAADEHANQAKAKLVNKLAFKP
jgi:hypothetical protein